MEENPECNCCNSWEEEMYWKHFNSVHFCLTLSSDFHDHLVLPEKFAAHIDDLPDYVTLKGPSGALWEIELLRSEDLLFVGDGWKDFVKVNGLNENCILVFNYKRSLSFEVLIFDKSSSCEKESAYFVKKRRHTESNHEDKKKKTASEASRDKIIERSDEEGSDYIVTKKSKKDGGEVVRSKEKLNTPTSKKRVLSAAARSKGKLRKVVPPRTPPSDKNIESGNSIRNKILKEPNHISQQDVITSENGGSVPKKHHSHNLHSQPKKNSNGDDIANEITQILKELNTPENGKNSLAADHSHILKAHSETPPCKNVTATERDQTSVKYLMSMQNGNGFRVIDNSYSAKAPSENRHSRNDTSKEHSHTIRKELITPENRESSPVVDCSPNFKDHAELSEKEPDESVAVKDVIPISMWGPVATFDSRESSPEKDHPCKSHGKRRQPKKQVLAKSSKKLVPNSARRSFSKEYISNRRPVTEEEKKDAWRRANQKETENSFIATMRPTCVYKRFFLQIPAEWQFRNLFRHKQEVILRVGEKSWHASIVNYGCKNRGISTGWKKFALENFLEEDDVLVFQLGNQKDEASVVIDVDIYRVIPSIVPPHPICS